MKEFNFNHLDPERATLVRALGRMIHQDTNPDAGFASDRFDGERTTMPYSAYATAVEILELYDVVTIITRVGRVITFKFNHGTDIWLYPVRKGDV